MESTIRILLAEDNPLVRHDLRNLLALSDRIEIAGEAADGAEAVELAARLRPDLVLMDLEMPRLDGFEATRQIKARRLAPAVMILSVHAYPAARLKAEQAGADAFIVKGSPLQSMFDAIFAICKEQES